MKKKISYKKKNKNSILGKKDKNKLKKIKEYLKKNKKQVGGNNANDNNGGNMMNNNANNNSGDNEGNNNNSTNNQNAEANAADAKEAEQVAKRAQGLKEEWKEELSKPKIQLLAELALYAMYTVAGAFIYYPSFLVNFPNYSIYFRY